MDCCETLQAGNCNPRDENHEEIIEVGEWRFQNQEEKMRYLSR